MPEYSNRACTSHEDRILQDPHQRLRGARSEPPMANDFVGCHDDDLERGNRAYEQAMA